MIFLGISLIISAAIIAATVILIFNKSIKLYKETYSSLFEEPVKTPETFDEIKFGGF